jgi:acetoin:2,6-dichlorophenolindophenol oxidoreductase subunit alpha
MTSLEGPQETTTERWARRDLYRTMLGARLAEERITAARVMMDHHSGVNYEAIGTGVGAAVRFTDPVQTGYRSGGAVCHARGMSLRELVLQGYGLIPSSRSQHPGGPRILRSTGILAGQLPTAAGVALASKLRGDDKVVVQFLGDGASNQGAAHEVYNIAGAKKLPMVLLIETNGVALSARLSDFSACSDLALRGAGYGIPSSIVDGTDVFAVHEAAAEALDFARNGNGPTLIELKITRPEVHATVVRENRSASEVEAARAADALRASGEILLQSGELSAEEDEQWREEINSELDEAFEEAEEIVRNRPRWVHPGQIGEATAWRMSHSSEPPTWMKG